jgi:ubiquinone/menaquinone biosynthesis C-methylase UbiE
MKRDSALSSLDQSEVIAKYGQRYAKHGATLAALNVGKTENYLRQHKAHLELMPSGATSVIDVGCGIGSFYTSLMNSGRSVHYIGIDIVPEFIRANTEKFPDAAFHCLDLFREGLPGMADHIVMCQVFNNRFKSSDNESVIKEAIRICFAAANLSLSIDMLSKYVNYEEDHLFYSDPEGMFAYAKTLTPFVALKHDYAPHHFTLALYKK